MDIRRSRLHRVASRPMVLPSYDIICWILPNSDIMTCIIVNHENIVIRSFRHDDIARMYKLQPIEVCLDK